VAEVDENSAHVKNRGLQHRVDLSKKLSIRSGFEAAREEFPESEWTAEKLAGKWYTQNGRAEGFTGAKITEFRSPGGRCGVCETGPLFRDTAVADWQPSM
jgi:hypothetical protein